MHVCMRGWGDAFIPRQSLSSSSKKPVIKVRNHKWEEGVGGDSWVLISVCTQLCTMDTTDLLTLKMISSQACTQPFSKGGYIEGMSQTIAAVMLWALAHSPSRGVWGHAPPENFGNLDSLRAILRHSDSQYH